MEIIANALEFFIPKKGVPGKIVDHMILVSSKVEK
jgi:hypothetical protein